MCISNVESSLSKYCRTTNFPSSLIAASPVGPGVVLVPLGGLEVAAVVVPPGGVAPSLPSVVGPLARPVCPPVLVAEGQAVVALAPPVVLVLVVEGLVLVVKALVLVVESLVLVLEVAVEPVVVVAEGLTVVAAASTVLLPSKESAKEPADQILKLSLNYIRIIFLAATLCQAHPRQELASFSFHWCCRCNLGLLAGKTSPPRQCPAPLLMPGFHQSWLASFSFHRS